MNNMSAHKKEPEDRKITYAEYVAAEKIVSAYRQQIAAEVKAIKVEHNSSVKNPDWAGFKKSLPLADFPFSVRLYGALSRISHFRERSMLHITINDLGTISLSKFEKMSNVGEGSIAELQSVCSHFEITLLP